MEKYYYLLIMICTLLGPLIMSFEKKVEYYKAWKSFFISNLPVALFFVLWDMYFTELGIWYFNLKYVSGLLIYNLPIEEVSFFIFVPFACIFIYQNVNMFISINFNKTFLKFIPFTILIFLSIIIGLFIFKSNFLAYTNSAILVFIVLLAFTFFQKLDFFSNSLIAYVICLIPFFIVNGLLTSIPIIIYNDLENCGIRIYTIPIEDIVYGFDLYFMNVILFEKVQKRNIL